MHHVISSPLKYNLGDHVYYMYDNKVQRGKIVARCFVDNLPGARIRSDAFGDSRIQYWMETGQVVSEHNLFETVDLLLNHLRPQD